jgi:FdhD protein
MVPGSSCSSFRHPLSRSFASSRTTGTWGGLAAILPTLGPARSIAFSILTIRGARPSLFSIRRQESCYSASRSRASPLVPHLTPRDEPEKTTARPQCYVYPDAGLRGIVARKPRSIDLTHVSEWDDGAFRGKQDYLAAEEPLEIRIGDKPLSVTMRTPGNDLELAAGFLFTEGLIERREQITSIEMTGDNAAADRGNVVQVGLIPEALPDMEKMRRNFFAASSCGICGKASIDSVRSRRLQPPNEDFRFDPEILVTMPDALRASQAVFGRTGGLHAAALFRRSGELLVLREDIGRHNAVDKIVGWALLEKRIPLSNEILLVSGRGGFEIIQKAIVAGVPVVASVSAPSSLASQLARELRLTLIGFLRGRRFVIYAGEERIEKK